MTFGDRLKELRKQHNLGQKEVGAWIGVSDSSIRKYEVGERTPTPDALVVLAEHFDVTVDYLLGRSSSPAAVSTGQLASDPTGEVFDDEIRTLARAKLKGSSPEQLAKRKEQIKKMIEVFW